MSNYIYTSKEKVRIKMSKGILTKREREVFELLIKNYTTRDIAEKLNISEKTVRNHISNVMQKLGVKGRSGAVVELLKLNEISL
jgi:LuxR family transcriptional regulator of spore coat protein